MLVLKLPNGNCTLCRVLQIAKDGVPKVNYDSTTMNRSEKGGDNCCGYAFCGTIIKMALPETNGSRNGDKIKKHKVVLNSRK